MPARVLHWILAVLIGVQVALGAAASRTAQPLSDRLLDQHVRLGLLILALMILRWSWRLAVRPPPLPPSVPRWQQRSAAFTHWLLYLLLLAMPVSGYILWAWIGPTQDFWGAGSIPIVFSGGEDEFWRSVAGYAHEYGAYLLVAVLAVHIGAALHHEFVRRDGLIRTRMGFRRSTVEHGLAPRHDGP